jgi:hypothetical protein
MGQYNGSERSGQPHMAPTRIDERISERARENHRELFHMRGVRERILILAL